jgi:uncharacterized protein
MEFEWDEAKNSKNHIKHGVGFDLARAFDWDNAIIEPDLRRDYGEMRYLARGLISGREGYHVVFTLKGERLCIISMRPFNRKDTRLWLERLNGRNT